MTAVTVPAATEEPPLSGPPPADLTPQPSVGPKRPTILTIAISALALALAGAAIALSLRAKSLGEDLAGVRSELGTVRSELDGTKTELTTAQGELVTMSSTLTSTRAQLDSANARIAAQDAAAADLASKTHTITVNFTFRGGVSGSPCTPSTGYSDISAGTPVRVTNDDGKLIGTASLGTGTSSGGTCNFVIRMYGVVVGNAKILSAEVANRGKISSTATELSLNSWTFYVVLG